MTSEVPVTPFRTLALKGLFPDFEGAWCGGLGL